MARKKNGKLATSHPTYPNPSIREALCEIHFRLADGEVWKPTLPGEFFKVIQGDYPEIEPALEVGLQFDLGPQRIGHSLYAPRQRMRYKHGSRSLFLQLGEDVFTVNVLPKYPGWDTMRADTLRAWRQVRVVIKPAAITRLGLRYINRVDRESPNDPPSDWFRAGDFVPAGVLRWAQPVQHGLSASSAST